MTSSQPDFDAIARPYRFLEYLTLGPLLQRCRTYHLPALLQQKHALVLGDGDGRFLARLLRANPHLHADAVDTSRTMLDLLTARCHAAYPTAAAHLHTHQADAHTFVASLPLAPRYDLIVTHFFLDCLPQPAVEALIQQLAPHLAPGALWLLSDFRIPARGAARPAGRILVRSLYLAFRLLTGLRTSHLPDHATPLTAAGFTPCATYRPAGGILTSELWQRASTAKSPSEKL